MISPRHPAEAQTKRKAAEVEDERPTRGCGNAYYVFSLDGVEKVEVLFSG